MDGWDGSKKYTKQKKNRTKKSEKGSTPLKSCVVWQI